MNRVPARLLLTAVLLVGGLAVSPPAKAVRSPLVLRVNDVAGKAGDVVAVVLRTTSARPIRQGRISVRPRRRSRGRREFRGASPFLGLEKYNVLSGQADALAVGVLQADANGQLVTLQFTSGSASVNRTDGTLAVLYLQLRKRLQPDDEYILDLEDVELLDADGVAIALEPLAGTLQVQGPQKRAALSIDSGDVAPGEDARFGIQSRTARPLGSGRLVLAYDPAIAAETPRVWINKKQGSRRSSVDTGGRGRIVVEFESRDGSFNEIPGEILSVRMKTREGLAPGTEVAIRFVPKRTVLRDPDGNVVPYRLRDGVLRFVADDDDGDDDGDDDDDGGGGDDDSGDDGGGDDGGGGDGGGDDGGGGDDDDDDDDDDGDDDSDDDDDDGDEFESTALTADVATSLIGLADGTIVLAMPQLAWDDDGDFTDLGSLATALQSGTRVRVRGKGEVNADGAIVATELRADLDD